MRCDLKAIVDDDTIFCHELTVVIGGNVGGGVGGRVGNAVGTCCLIKKYRSAMCNIIQDVVR